MSGSTNITECPRCGGDKLQTFSDWKPYDMSSGICLDCGFAYTTVEKQATLEEVNSQREMYDLLPLAELAKQEITNGP